MEVKLRHFDLPSGLFKRFMIMNWDELSPEDKTKVMGDFLKALIKSHNIKQFLRDTFGWE
jgi:hypothetical protein